MPEVIASCFVESIGTNVLFVKDIYPNSNYIIAYINDNFYSVDVVNRQQSVEFVKHGFENELIYIQDKSVNITYFIWINGRNYGCLRQYYRFRNDKIQQFVIENRDLFEYDGRPILK